MAISTNGTVIARLAGGLYNTVISNATYLEVAAQDPSTLANTLYARDFAKSTDLAVATTLVTNLGLSSVAGLDNWVAAQLTAAGSAKGAKIVSLLNDFAGMSADTTYGAAATAFNTKVDAALAASQKTGSVESKFETAGVVAVANATFTLTTGVDVKTGGAGDDTFNATAAQLNAFDTLTGGAGNDTLTIDDTATGALADLSLPTITGIENITIQSKLGLLGAELDVTGIEGLTKVTVDMSAAAAQTIAADTTTALAIVNTTANDLTIVGGGGASSFTTTVGGDIVVGDAAGGVDNANAYTSVSAKTGTAGTVTIVDNSGASGAIGSTLTSATVTSATGAVALTGKGLTEVTLSKTGGNVTVTNATAGHSLGLTVKGVTAGTITDAVATAVSVTTAASTLAATANVFTGLSASKAATISTDGTKGLTLGTITAPKLTTLTVAGAGGVDADVSGAGSTSASGYVTTVDTSASTAATSTTAGTIQNNITIGTSTAFVGGAGADKVNVGGSTKAIALGAGNDTLNLSATLGTGGTADGGDGTDTIQLTNALAVTAGSSTGTLNAKVSNFEKLSISATTLTADATIDLGYLAKVNSYVKLAAFGGAYTETISNLATGGTVELTGDNTTTSITIGVNNSSYSTSDSVNIKLTADDVVLAGGTVTTSGVETVNVITNNSHTSTAANPTDDITDTITIVGGASLKAVTVSGNAGLTLTVDQTGVVALTSIDASGITTTGETASANAFSYTSGAVSNTSNANLVITGTAQGVNTINVSAITNALQTTTISVGGTANVSANVFTGGAAADTVTGGSGNDSFSMGGARDVITTGAGNDSITLPSTAVSRDTVTDFSAGVTSASNDKIITASYLKATDYFTKTAAAATFNVATNSTSTSNTSTTGSVLELSFAANSAVNLGDNSADSLTGVNLLKGAYDGETAATISESTAGDITYVVGYQNGNAYVYLSSNTASTIIGSELTLVGILQNVAVGAITSDNFSA